MERLEFSASERVGNSSWWGVLADDYDIKIKSLEIKSWDKSVFDFSGIGSLPYLEDIDMQNKPLLNTYELSKLTNLKNVQFYGCNMNNLDWAKNLTKLERIRVFGNNISSLIPLENKNTLIVVDFRNNCLYDNSSEEIVNESTGETTTITKKNLKILADIRAANNTLSEVYLDGNNGITDYSPLTSVGWNINTGGFN